jgi:hypothetical protein
MTEERDPRISQHYRSLGSEAPSRELDQTILAAAHRALDRSHAPLVTPAGRHRWYFAFGAAAILVLAVAVTVQIERQQPDAEALPAAPAVAPPSEGFLSREDTQKETKRAEVQKQAARSKALADAERDRAPAAQPRREAVRESVPQSAPAPAPAAKPESADGAVLRERNATEARLASSAAPVLDPQSLLKRIAELRTEGRHEEADKLLAEFRQRYPDYRIPEEMLQKVERKK